jgi:hypothetical protein
MTKRPKERRRGERRKLVAYVVMAIFSAGGIATSVRVDEQQHRSDRAFAAQQTAAAKKFAEAQTATVQRERRRSTLISCQQQNTANTRTKRKAARIPPGPQRAFTYSLIDSLAPHQNCARLDKRRVSTSPKP